MVEQESLSQYKLYVNIYAGGEQKCPDHLLIQSFSAFSESPLEI